MHPPCLEPGEKEQVRAAPESLQVVYRVSSSLQGLEDSLFRALSGRLKSTARRHEFNKDLSLLSELETF